MCLTAKPRIAVLVVAAAFIQPAIADQISGQASVIDGDTIEIHGRRIRLWGVDAIESKQLCFDLDRKPHRCGQQAANALADKITAAAVVCNAVDQDRYGRTVAVCSARGENLNEWLVSAGWAIDYRQYSDGAFAAAEATARKSKLGNWQYEWRLPSSYRACLRLGVSSEVQCSLREH